jgi:hypothetical protein
MVATTTPARSNTRPSPSPFHACGAPTLRASDQVSRGTLIFLAPAAGPFVFLGRRPTATRAHPWHSPARPTDAPLTPEKPLPSPEVLLDAFDAKRSGGG